MEKASGFSVYDFSPRQRIATRLEDKAFEFWLKTWKDSYKFFGWTDSVYSDQWTRQDSILTLFHASEPIGSIFFKEHDLTRPFVKADTYFRMWPEVTLSELAAAPDAARTLVSSWFTLHPDWRKARQGVDAKFILGGVGLQKFFAAQNQTLLGTMVTMSGMHTLTYELGARTLVPALKEKNLEVDLVRWRKSELQNYQYPRLGEEITQIWEASLGRGKTRSAG